MKNVLGRSKNVLGKRKNASLARCVYEMPNGGFRVIKFYNGKMNHIACFKNIDEAKRCVSIMDEYDMNDEQQRQRFVEKLRREFANENL